MKETLSEERREYNRKAYKKRIETNPNYNKEFYLNQKDKEGYIKSHNKARNKWNERNPEKRLAQIRAYDNIKIPKNKLCQVCNKNKAIERHHPDYSKQLEVMFLCRNCHREIHKPKDTDTCECEHNHYTLEIWREETHEEFKDVKKSIFREGECPEVFCSCKKFKAKKEMENE